MNFPAVDLNIVAKKYPVMKEWLRWCRFRESTIYSTIQYNRRLSSRMLLAKETFVPEVIGPWWVFPSGCFWLTFSTAATRLNFSRCVFSATSPNRGAVIHLKTRKTSSNNSSAKTVKRIFWKNIWLSCDRRQKRRNYTNILSHSRSSNRACSW